MAHRAARHGESLVCSRIIHVSRKYLFKSADFVDAYNAVPVMKVEDLPSMEVESKVYMP